MKIAYVDRKFAPQTLETISQAGSIVEEYQAQDLSLTLRQLYYQFVARGYLANSDKSYKRLSSVLSDARRAGLIDWEAIEDRTRYLRQQTRWTSPAEILKSAVSSYHKDLWTNQACRVEVWIEKDALVGVIDEVCRRYDVPYFSCRGFVSDSEMWRAGYERIHKDNGQAAQWLIILHLGDHDPSGVDMSRDIRDRLTLFSNGGYLQVERIALTMEQVRQLNPPPNPTNLDDSRASDYVAKFGTSSWELDALNPTYLRDLVEKHIIRWRNETLWNEAVKQQEDERQSLAALVDDAKS